MSGPEEAAALHALTCANAGIFTRWTVKTKYRNNLRRFWMRFF